MTSSPVYHGQGGGKDDENPELKQFCRAVATGLETAINASGTPLILAGDAALLAIFQRDADGKIEFSKETLSGNFDDAKPESIYEKAEQVVQRLQKAKGRIAAERYQERAAMEQGSDIFDTIVAAAREGRVDTLLIREMGGDPADKGPESVVPSAHKCNELVALCLEHGGNIEVLDNEIMPTEARIAAIYRY